MYEWGVLKMSNIHLRGLAKFSVRLENKTFFNISCDMGSSNENM